VFLQHNKHVHKHLPKGTDTDYQQPTTEQEHTHGTKARSNTPNKYNHKPKLHTAQQQAIQNLWMPPHQLY
jgi:hypothetical protein